MKVDVRVDESASTYKLIEEWETFSAHDNYVSWRTERDDLDDTGDPLEGGFEGGL